MAPNDPDENPTDEEDLEVVENDLPGLGGGGPAFDPSLVDEEFFEMPEPDLDLPPFEFSPSDSDSWIQALIQSEGDPSIGVDSIDWSELGSWPRGPDEDEVQRLDPSRLAQPGESRDSGWGWWVVGIGIGGIVVVWLVIVLFFDSPPEPPAATTAATELGLLPPSDDLPTDTVTPSTALFVGDEPLLTVATSPAIEAAETQPPTTETPTVDLSASPFPSLWVFTATKTADLVREPDSLDTGEVGLQLDLFVIVNESCTSDLCTYSSVVERLDRFSELIGAIPEARWMVDGPKWSLEAAWQTNPDCVTEHFWTYQFTVTETDEVDGRTVPAAFEGTWVQGETGPCNGGWEAVAEWSIVGTAAPG